MVMGAHSKVIQSIQVNQKLDEILDGLTHYAYLRGLGKTVSEIRPAWIPLVIIWVMSLGKFLNSLTMANAIVETGMVQ